MPTPIISVVMPVYNAADTLPRAVESILNQTFRDIELVVLDDGSTDDSLTVAGHYEKIDRRLHVISSRHAGIVDALILACNEARGEYIARMDADDFSAPERLASQMDLMDKKNITGICGAQVRMTGPSIGYGRKRYETWINRLVTHEDLVREAFVECPIPHPTFLMRREIYVEVGGYQDQGWPEDYDLFMRMLLCNKEFGKVSAPLLEWAESPKRLSMTSSRYSPENFRALKRHYLFRSCLANDRPFVQWGAGEVGKRWLREWTDRRPQAVVDINPRKIGRAIHGIDVIEPDDLPGPGAAFIVVAVGAPTARDEIRRWLCPRGYVEMKDFVFLA